MSDSDGISVEEEFEGVLGEVEGGEEEKPKPSTSAGVDKEKLVKIRTLQRAVVDIKNKLQRKEVYSKLKREKRKVKKELQKQRQKEREELGDAAPPKQVPHTIESLRESDITTVEKDDEEVQCDISQDEFASYYSKSYEPKILITSSDNPHTKTMGFVRELVRIIPHSECRWRHRSSVKKMIKRAGDLGFTDIIVVNEDRRVPNGLLICHLPDGPTAYFKISNVQLIKEIRRKPNEITSHRPEVILNNFQTRLGQTVGRMLGSIFHYDPQFRGRRAVTFHNQRDYIFFRHHRYEFKSEKKVALRELGPRFTLRLQWIQKGTFDTIEGEYEWIIAGKRHELETSRRRFFL
uniref:EOG090X09U6 n=1 Tax=Lynceus sp. MCZ IZ 141354 TaxID=1930659 RepID=A0A9N6WRC9_9CRUS|nr:EOG090X09U6 [Lynceus sp. MCZ IZ 141354]